MPAKNRIKIYIENAYYHAYNRGVEKREIFLDDQDYRVFLSFLKFYLSPPEIPLTHPILGLTGPGPVRFRPLKNFSGEIILLAYCLMPNHFHLLLWQRETTGMTRFIQALNTSYSMFFNKKYKRVGTLYQGPYKAVNIENDVYLLHLSRYIHLNPNALTGPGPVRAVRAATYPYSSYAYYLERKKAAWVNPHPVLDFFKTAKRTRSLDFLSYQSFIEDFKEDPQEFIGVLAIET